MFWVMGVSSTLTQMAFLFRGWGHIYSERDTQTLSGKEGSPGGSQTLCGWTGSTGLTLACSRHSYHATYLAKSQLGLLTRLIFPPHFLFGLWGQGILCPILQDLSSWGLFCMVPIWFSGDALACDVYLSPMWSSLSISTGWHGASTLNCGHRCYSRCPCF